LVSASINRHYTDFGTNVATAVKQSMPGGARILTKHQKTTVIPANTGIQQVNASIKLNFWTPVCTGVTDSFLAA
jgi:hypothetical protein